MFDDEALEDYLSGYGVTEEGKIYIRRVRQSEPARSVGSGARNVTTRFASRKMGRVIQAESHRCELPAVWQWEHDAKTFEFWDQPESVSVPIVRRDGRSSHSTYTPDYLLLQDGYVGWVECKYRAWLERQAAEGNVNYSCDSEGRWHYLPGERAAAALGMQHVVRLEEDNNLVLVDNLSFLADYLVSDAAVVSDEARSAIDAAFNGQGWLLLHDLLHLGSGLPADQLYLAILAEHLYVDLERDRLSEKDRTFVFRDRSAAQAYGLYSRASTRVGAATISSVELSPGKRVCWDGNVWTRGLLPAGRANRTAGGWVVLECCRLGQRGLACTSVAVDEHVTTRGT